MWVEQVQNFFPGENLAFFVEDLKVVVVDFLVDLF